MKCSSSLTVEQLCNDSAFITTVGTIQKHLCQIIKTDAHIMGLKELKDVKDMHCLSFLTCHHCVHPNMS